MSDLSILRTAGVSAFDGEPFVLIQILVDGQEVASGQATPAEMRAEGAVCFESAEAAEHDAAVLAELIDTVGLDEKTAIGFINALRERRAEP